MKTNHEYRQTHVERRLNRTSSNIDPGWDYTDEDAIKHELDLADATRSEDREW